MLMDRKQFSDQLRAAREIPDDEAFHVQTLRQGLGHTAVIRWIPINGSPAEDPSFWRDVAGKAQNTDGIAPHFSQLPDGSLVRGVAVWRAPEDI